MDRFSAHLDRGWDLAMRGETTAALVAVRQALEINGDAPEAHNLMGYVRSLDGDYDEALECYRRAIDLDEWYLEPILNAAELLAHPEADPEESITLCRRAANMELGPEELADTLLIQVDALLSLDREDEARAHLERLEADIEVPTRYRVVVGRLLFDLGERERALAVLDRAVESDGGCADARYVRGIISRESGRRVAAVLDFLETLRLDSGADDFPLPEPSELRRMIDDVIDGLPPEVRAELDGAELRVADRPTPEQVRDEVDPRQVVLAEGVDPGRRAFERVFVFRYNLGRVAGPARWREEISRQFSLELGYDPEGDAAGDGDCPF